MSDPKTVDPSETKKLAIQSNGQTWKLLQKKDRSREETLSMLGAAYASLYLWDRVGTDLHRARGHWLIHRAAVAAEHSDLAQAHASLCAEYTQRSTDAADFDRAYAVEARARALAMCGEKSEAALLKTQATQLGADIADHEDRKIFESDLGEGPWFGV